MLNVRLGSACGLVVALTFVGCGDKYDGRMEVSGKVTLKKQPIKDGAQVQFVPLDGQGTGSTAMTKDGAYTIPRQSGLKPGKYLIRVSLGDGKTAVNPVDADSPPGPGGGANIISKNLIPKDWSENSKQEREVKADGPNAFDFDIP